MFNNKWLNLSIISQMLLMLVISYVPFLQEPFHTFSLSAVDWAIVILLAGSVFPVLEISKVIIRWQERRKLARIAS